jgi:hypothetical protein
MRFQDLEANVSRADPNVLRIADAKVDVPYIHAVSGYYAKTVIRHKPA